MFTNDAKLRPPLKSFPFSSPSHAVTAAFVAMSWQCVFNDVQYHITHLLIFHEVALQLTLHDATAVYLTYRSPRRTEFVLYFYHLNSSPTLNKWDQIRFLDLCRNLLHVYRAPYNFRKNTLDREVHVTPVPVPFANGFPGQSYISSPKTLSYLILPI